MDVKYILMKAILRTGLQMTDVDLDARVTALEENGGGNSQNGKSFKITTDFATVSHFLA